MHLSKDVKFSGDRIKQNHNSQTTKRNINLKKKKKAWTHNLWIEYRKGDSLSLFLQDIINSNTTTPIGDELVPVMNGFTCIGM